MNRRAQTLWLASVLVPALVEGACRFSLLFRVGEKRHLLGSVLQLEGKLLFCSGVPLGVAVDFDFKGSKVLVVLLISLPVDSTPEKCGLS